MICYIEVSFKAGLTILHLPKQSVQIATGAVVIVGGLDVQLPMQSEPKTTKVVSANPTRAGCAYNIMS